MALPHFLPIMQLGDSASVGGFAIRGAGEADYTGFNFGHADVNGDGLSDLIVCADGYDGGGLLAGGAFVIYGKRDAVTSPIDLANLVQTDGFVIQGEFAFDLASRMIAGAGDMNGDGIEDMVIGAFKNDAGGTDSGAAYIIYGRTSPFDSVLDLYDLPADVGIKIVGEATGDYASFWVASAGDVNGDGRDDIIMGAPQNDAGGADAGAAYVIFGRDSDYPETIRLSTLDPSVGFKITGATASDNAGLAVGSAGDIDGDGIDDLVIGAPQNETSGTGRAYILYGRADIGAIDLSRLTGEQGFVIQGESSGDLLGFNVARIGDVNGDGLNDLAIGAPYDDAGGPKAGAAYVILGDSDRLAGTFDLATLDGTNGFKVVGAVAGGELGTSVAGAGDVNGDGYDDLLIGAWVASGVVGRAGEAYVLFGKAGGYGPAIDLATMSQRDGIRIRTGIANDTLGRAVSSAGDMNGDGYADIAVGAPGNSAVASEAGAAYVLYGRPDNTAPIAVATHVAGSEDVVLVLQGADFGFADADGDTLLAVRIATLATRGALMLRGANGGADITIVEDQIISVADIAAGRLVFAAEANASGRGYAQFTFGVSDDGGIVANGRDTSVTTATLTIDIAADTTDAQDLIYGTAGDDVLVASGLNVHLIGLAGDDTYTVSSQAHAVIEAIGGGIDTITTSVSYTLSQTSEIEALVAANPTATTNLRLEGNAFDNLIRGDAGANSLIGGGGTDNLEGLGGDDSYIVAGPLDRVIEAQGGGYDTIYALGDYVLTPGAEVEILVSYDRAVAFAQTLTGNERDNVIIGNDGNNILGGGGGRDTLYGLRGDDIFQVDSRDDLPVELAGEGVDTIVTSVSYVMPQGMEFEILRTIDPTATIAIDLTGNKIPNIIIGNAGNNVIDGLGGGDDMQGLDGDDTYIVHRTSDIVRESSGGGEDVVRTLVNYALSSTAVIERLEAHDPLNTVALQLTGNRFANTLIGNAGVNTLIGAGGEDWLYGLGGDDSYLVEDAQSRVIEAVGQGYDTVYTLADYALEAGSAIDALTVYDRTTTGALHLSGNELAQTIYGNDGVNGLRSGGGADILYGLGGDDHFVVDSADAQVIEFAGGGYDTVYATGSFALGMDAEVETLTVYDWTTRNALNLTGSGIANRIIGNDGVNVIDGKGGADTLFGLGGADTFAFSTALGADNVDTVIGFVSGSDRIRLSSTIFAGLAPGDLAPGAFATGSIATESDDRILYDHASGALLYDPDGNGSAIATCFALFDPETLLTAGDFLIG